MKHTLTKIISGSIASVLTFLAVYTVNSTCLVGLGQEEEPTSLNKLKKLS